MRKSFCVVLLLLLLMIPTMVGAISQISISNPGFEDDSGSLPGGWEKLDWNESQGGTSSTYGVDTSVAYIGAQSAFIESTEPNDARLKQKVIVDGDCYYRISCSVKTENIDSDAKGANVSIESISETSLDIRGTNDTWQLIEIYGKTHKKQTEMTVTLGLGGYESLNTGKAWFDDILIEKLDAKPTGVTIVNLFDPDTYSFLANLELDWLVFLSVLAVIILAIGIFILWAPVKAAWQRHKTKLPLPKEDRSFHIPTVTRLKLHRKDVVVMTVMTLLYLLGALYNLGSLKAPETYWEPASSDETTIIDFNREVDLARIGYFTNIGRSNYNIQYKDASGTYQPLGMISLDNYEVFKWKYLDFAPVRTSSISVTADFSNIYSREPQGLINELAFFESGSTAPLTDMTISGSTAESSDKKGPRALIDEQQTVAYTQTYMNSTYFDEIYHARTAYEHLHQIYPYEITHPPLGKLFISIGIALFGMNTFGWRIIGTLFGAAMIPLMYVFGKKMFGKSFYGFCAAFLMMFDFMHFTQTRIATIDVYVTFFVILMFYYMYDYFINKSYLLGFKASLKPLFLSGLFFGLGAASKWIAIYGAVGLALLFFTAKYLEYRDYRLFKSDSATNGTPWLKGFISRYITGTMGLCVIFFIAIPVGIYILSYIPYMITPGSVKGLQVITNNQEYMYNYHSNLVATHPFSSSWWEWPIMYKPIWYYIDKGLPAGQTSTIVAFGNPAVWWVGLIAVFSSLYLIIAKNLKKLYLMIPAVLSIPLAIFIESKVTDYVLVAIAAALLLFAFLPKSKKRIYLVLPAVLCPLLAFVFQPATASLILLFIAVGLILYSVLEDKNLFVLLTAITAQYLPWVLVPRLTFIYHYFTIVPFLILVIVYIIKVFLEKYPDRKFFVYLYLGVTAALFLWFYPALSGAVVESSYIEALKWFGSWVF